MFSFLESPQNFHSIAELAFIFGILGTAMITDIKTKQIPNKISYSALFISVIYFLIFKDFDVFLSHLFGFFIVLFFGFIAFYFRLMGGGDIKLFLFLGFVFPPQHLLELFLIIFVIGGIQGLWSFYKKEKKIPYAVSIFVGTLIYCSTTT